MKFNISGRGIIPGLKCLAPVRGVELDEKQVSRLINYRQFRVYVAESGLLVTRVNLNKIFIKKQNYVKPVIKPAIKPIPPVNTAKPVEIVDDKKDEGKPVELGVVTPTEDGQDIVFAPIEKDPLIGVETVDGEPFVDNNEGEDAPLGDEHELPGMSLEGCEVEVGEDEEKPMITFLNVTEVSDEEKTEEKTTQKPYNKKKKKH